MIRAIGTLVVVGLATPVSVVAAQGAITFAATSMISVEGTSNVHDWKCDTKTFDATLKAPDASAADAGKLLTSMTVTIPVRTLDCGKGDMNKNLQKAMHADDHPTIKFRMTSYDAVPRNSAYAGVIHGVLTINGKDKPIDLNTTITPDGSGGATAVGTVELKTTDYDVSIVKLFFGTLRTSPDVKITLHLTASRA